MGQPLESNQLIDRVFWIVAIGITCEIVAMVILGF